MGSAHDGRAHRPCELRFDLPHGVEDVRVPEVVGDHHQVDVAARGVGALGDRTIDKGRLDPLGVGFEGAAQWLGDPDRLDGEAVEFSENW